ncbi:hypothetical protein FA014_18985 [Cellulomonas hominis]|uniref:Uncharacterized protein n=1 Tax=Cellulomonas hominis TaxID=156981 RepID=A0A7Z8NP16_9CELL|nr:hypothetical protein FA014_18985 [Cellulomonas hominis]
MVPCPGRSRPRRRSGRSTSPGCSCSPARGWSRRRRSCSRSSSWPDRRARGSWSCWSRPPARWPGRSRCAAAAWARRPRRSAGSSRPSPSWTPG